MTERTVNRGPAPPDGTGVSVGVASGYWPRGSVSVSAARRPVAGIRPATSPECADGEAAEAGTTEELEAAEAGTEELEAAEAGTEELEAAEAGTEEPSAGPDRCGLGAAAANVVALPIRPRARPTGPPGNSGRHLHEVLGALREAADDLRDAAAAIAWPAPDPPCALAGEFGRLDSVCHIPGTKQAPGSYADPEARKVSVRAGPDLAADGHLTRDHGRIEFRLLGCFRVTRIGTDIPNSTFGGRRTRQLVQALLRDRGRLVARDELIEALWPDSRPTSPEANLAVLVSRARHALGEGNLILGRSGGYLFADDDRCWLDTEAFTCHVEQGRVALASGKTGAALLSYRSALSLWAGDPFMESMYSDWTHDFRLRLSLLREEALEGYARASLEMGQAATAVHAARQLTEQAPLREQGHVLLMKSLMAAGDPASAIAAFHDWRHRLSDELGVDPSDEVSQLFQRILRHEPLGCEARGTESPDGYPLPGGSATGQAGRRPDTAPDVIAYLPDAVYLLDRDDRLAYVNDSGSELAGLPRDSLAGRAAGDVFPADWRQSYLRSVEIARAAETPTNFRVFWHPIGSWLDWTVCPAGTETLVVARSAAGLVRAQQRVFDALAIVEAASQDLKATLPGHG